MSALSKIWQVELSHYITMVVMVVVVVVVVGCSKVAMMWQLGDYDEKYRTMLQRDIWLGLS